MKARRWPLVLAGLLALALAVSAAPGRAADSFVDDAGQEIVVPGPYRRIVSLYPAHTDNLVDLGAGQQLIAAGPSPTPSAPDLPLMSYRDDPERVMALNPDLVLLRPMVAQVHPQFVVRLRQFGVTVACLQPGGAAELYQYWRRLGLLAGRQAEAEALCVRFQADLAALAARVAQIPPERRPRVFFESIHRQFKTFAPDSLAIFALSAAGGINAAADTQGLRDSAIAEYGHERVLALAESVDVYLAQVGTMNRVTLEAIKDTPGFQALKAVRAGRVHLIDEPLVSRPTPRLIQGARQIQAILYPDLPPTPEARP